MPNPKTPVAVRRMNGNPSGRPMPEVSLVGSHIPLGDPPATMSKIERETWVRISCELPHLNATNRAVLELAVYETVRYLELRDFFRKRRIDMKKRKLPTSFAELDDDNPSKRHPLIFSYKDARDFYKSIIGTELGGSPVVQARILDYLDSNMRAKNKAQRDADEQYLT